MVAVVVGAAGVVIAIPLLFVLRALSQLSQRTTALTEALDEVKVTAALAAEVNGAAELLERPGGA